MTNNPDSAQPEGLAAEVFDAGLAYADVAIGAAFPRQAVPPAYADLGFAYTLVFEAAKEVDRSRPVQAQIMQLQVGIDRVLVDLMRDFDPIAPRYSVSMFPVRDGGFGFTVGAPLDNSARTSHAKDLFNIGYSGDTGGVGAPPPYILVRPFDYGFTPSLGLMDRVHLCLAYSVILAASFLPRKAELFLTDHLVRGTIAELRAIMDGPYSDLAAAIGPATMRQLGDAAPYFARLVEASRIPGAEPHPVHGTLVRCVVLELLTGGLAADTAGEVQTAERALRRAEAKATLAEALGISAVRLNMSYYGQVTLALMPSGIQRAVAAGQRLANQSRVTLGSLNRAGSARDRSGVGPSSTETGSSTKRTHRR